LPAVWSSGESSPAMLNSAIALYSFLVNRKDSSNGFLLRFHTADRAAATPKQQPMSTSMRVVLKVVVTFSNGSDWFFMTEMTWPSCTTTL